MKKYLLLVVVVFLMSSKGYKKYEWGMSLEKIKDIGLVSLKKDGSYGRKFSTEKAINQFFYHVFNCPGVNFFGTWEYSNAYLPDEKAFSVYKLFGIDSKHEHDYDVLTFHNNRLMAYSLKLRFDVLDSVNKKLTAKYGKPTVSPKRIKVIEFHDATTKTYAYMKIRRWNDRGRIIFLLDYAYRGIFGPTVDVWCIYVSRKQFDYIRKHIANKFQKAKAFQKKKAKAVENKIE